MIWLVQLVIDCADPDAIVQFWGGALGYRNPLVGIPDDDIAAFRRAHPQFDGHGRIDDHDLMGAEPGPARFDLAPGLRFVETQSAKHVKNRLHVDLDSTDVVADRARLVHLGAEVVQWDTDHVLVDPEGNEFCLSGRARPTSARS